MPKFKREGKSILDPNLTRTPMELVRIFLLSKGRSRRGPIEKFVEEKTGKKYYDHKGLDYILKALEEDGRVRKLPKEPGRPYPVYELTPKGIDDISLEADYFATEAMIDLVSFNLLEKQTFDSSLEKAVKKIGVYTIFSYLKGWKKVLEDTSENEVELITSWLHNTLPMRGISTYLENIIEHSNPNRKDRHLENFDDSETMRCLDVLEKRLAEIFPDETKLYTTIINDTTERKETIKQLITRQREIENYTRSVNNRNEESAKNKIKPKECPKCHYDGITPIQKKPSKGVMLEGVVTLKSLKREALTCPNCGFRQVRKRS